MPESDDDLLARVSPEERAQRRELGDAMMTFVQEVVANGEILPPQFPGKPRPIQRDLPMLEHCREKYRQAVEKAAAQGIEVSLCWHTLAIWTTEGRERIGYFARALACVESNRDAHLRPANKTREWSDVHMRAECLYEIGRVHAHEGDPKVANDFLMRAMPLAQEAEALRKGAGVEHDDRLEGKIAELLLQLP